MELFYSFKNETDDRVRDEVLISYMKEAFDGECAGSVELLAEEALPKLVYEVNGRLAKMFQMPQDAGGDRL